MHELSHGLLTLIRTIEVRYGTQVVSVIWINMVLGHFCLMFEVG